MTPERPICVLIAALGGQGGGVLVDWLVEAARHAGFPAQATSIAGVAQRTGATTYYFELYPDRNPAGTPVFSLFPDEDGVDLMAALEPTEAHRSLERGLITARTTVITAVKRQYSTAEKIIAQDGRAPLDDMVAALNGAADRLVMLDIDAIARTSGGRGNAVLFGAIAGAGTLPLGAEDCRTAIHHGGKAVAANLAGFEAGLSAAGAVLPRPPVDVFDTVPTEFAADLDDWPADLRPLIGHALAQLVDFQDHAYARTYLDRLRDLDADGSTTRVVAKRLAAWMTNPDVIRVAELKTRAGRFADVRADLGLPDDASLRVIDYLRPGAEEIAAVLPPRLARLWLATGWMKDGFPVRISTGSAWGFAMMKAMAMGRRWRRRATGFAAEQAAMTQWLAAVKAAAPRPGLARATADLAVWARGYGAVRRRGLAELDRLFADWPARLAGDAEALDAEVAGSLQAARTDPDSHCAAPS